MIDMWAFGCTFYEVAHIKPMFSGAYFPLMRKIVNNELSKFEADCPEDFKKALMRCFEANPANRPDALEFIEAVESVKFNMQPSATSHRFVGQLSVIISTYFFSQQVDATNCVEPEQAKRPLPTKLRYGDRGSSHFCPNLRDFFTR